MSQRALTDPLERLHGIQPVGDPLVFGRFHKDFLTYRGLALEARVRAKTLFAHSREGAKFLIICRPRSGSTLLCDLLGSTPDIHCELEMLHYKVLKPRSFLNALAAKRRAPVYGCKALSYQLVEVQRLRAPRRLFEALRRDGFQFIHLTRNTFDQCLSLTTAQATGGYFETAAPAGGKTAARHKIDPDLFVRQVRWNDAMLRFEKDLLDEFSPVTVDYDNDLATPEAQQRTVDRLCETLGARTAEIKTRFRKVAKASFSDSVINSDEILQALRVAGFASLASEATDAAPAMSGLNDATSQTNRKTW